ncbi:hypothetical protein BDZ45DRAFT_689731 [Acephala macrosclerotiorum]|nr:hypothetical protein BDZ45DRAFT_689731 [Acephala macrosclerotiorum]
MGNKKKTNHKAPANRSHLLSLPTINPEFDPCILDLTPKFNNEPEGEYDLSPEIQKAGLKLRRTLKNDEIAVREEKIVEQEEEIAEQQNRLVERELKLQAHKKKYSILKSPYEQSLPNADSCDALREENETLMKEKDDLLERLYVPEIDGINKNADTERLEYWLEERDTLAEKFSQQHECAGLEKENEVLSTRLAEGSAEIGKCWQDIGGKYEEIERLEEYSANFARAEYINLEIEHEDLKLKYEKLEQIMEGKKRLSKAMKRNRNLLAKEELQTKIAYLEGHIRDLKTLGEHTESLVKIGAAIQMRYMKLEKVNHLGTAGRLDRWVVEAGNNAAHEEMGQLIGPYPMQVLEVWQTLGMWSIPFMDSAVTRTTLLDIICVNPASLGQKSTSSTILRKQPFTGR